MDPLDAIKTVFFQECAELLGALERGLLAIQDGDADADAVDSVFRAAHSIKGAAGAFGFDALVAFAHHFETTLDLVRTGALAPTPATLAALLQAADVLADLVAAAQGVRPANAARAEAAAAALLALSAAASDAASGPPPQEPPVEERPAPITGEGALIRVDAERVDRLMNLVGELVIHHAVLAQRAAQMGLARGSPMGTGLEDLEHLTRALQDSVMAIRAQPVRTVFQRMPRLVRELAAATGKSVRLVTEGEDVEVDKTVVERLSEPLTHLLRNAIDHGLEPPDERRAAGKPEEGVVRLRAAHRSGRIVVEVGDDGRGVNRARVRAIAEERGLVAPGASLTEEEIDALMFLPGFSTASAVSNISGRGVGMDVVKRSLQALGGRISVASRPGEGATFALSLPLTLAVLDGMVVSVEGERLVAPIGSIVESLRPQRRDIKPIGARGAVLAARGGFAPLIDLGVALGWRQVPIDPADAVVMLVDGHNGDRAALVVDRLDGQRQVVIKSLEANYQQVPGVSAATILGDGRVALILDVDTLIQRHAASCAAPLAMAG